MAGPALQVIYTLVRFVGAVACELLLAGCSGKGWAADSDEDEKKFEEYLESCELGLCGHYVGVGGDRFIWWVYNGSGYGCYI